MSVEQLSEMSHSYPAIELQQPAQPELYRGKHQGSTCDLERRKAITASKAVYSEDVDLDVSGHMGGEPSAAFYHSSREINMFPRPKDYKKALESTGVSPEDVERCVSRFAQVRGDLMKRGLELVIGKRGQAVRPLEVNIDR